MTELEEMSLKNGGVSVNLLSPDEIRRRKWKSYLSQIIASTIKNFLLFDLGLAVAFPTIVIPALQLKNPVFENGNHTTVLLDDGSPVETFHLTSAQISWFSSIAFICQPLGGVMSGWVTEPFGRKKAMFLVNIPFVAAWIMMYLAASATQVLIADVLMGVGVGFMEAAVLTYVGEIAEPAIRGLLTSCASLSVTLGVFVTYFLGSVVYWRTAAIICLSVPVVTAIAILFVPETPLWLLSQGRREDAIKSLRWLRGWTTEEAVAQEFNAIEEHHRATDICAACNRRNITVCAHSRSSIGNRVQELFTAATMKPFLIITICSLFGHLAGVTAIRQYYVQIYETYDVPMNAKTATVLAGFVGLFGNIVLLLVLKKVGKRMVCMISFVGMGLCGVALGSYAWNTFPAGQTSFDHSAIAREGKGLFPMIVFFASAFLFNFGVNAIPWMLLSEIFPFKSRGLATGISAGLNYVCAFIATKTYLNVERDLGLAGSPWFYASFAITGAAILHFILPETEGRTLEDIERHFAEKGRSFMDRHIKINDALKVNGEEPKSDQDYKKTSSE